MGISYQVFDPAGRQVLESDTRCRYPQAIELQLLDAGYVVKIAGKKLTKTEARKGVK